MLAVGYAVLSPLRNPQEVRDDDRRSDRLAELEIRKEAKYGEILDAEADFHAGKLSRQDYRGLDRALRQEAVAILAEIDRASGKTPEGG
jgi:hypothetical protein